VSPGQVIGQAERLLTLLDSEFEALKIQDLTLFESYQSEKMSILQGLGALKLPESGPEVQAWAPFLDLVKDCQDRHRRNQILIQRKLDAIRGALNTLQGAEAASSVEVYDKLGRLSAGRRGRGLGDA
jgi:flagellar biosynthesis/type III secretory pathway chaperone